MLSNKAKIESLLFVSGSEGITLGQLSQLTNMMKPAVKEQLAALEAKYAADPDTSLCLLTAGETYRLATKKSLATVVKEYFESPAMTTLSKAALETLAIIAYKQPVTRVEIEEIRGVQSAGVIQKLLLYDLITEQGRLNIPGRPFKYGTTDHFLDFFGLTSLSDLPVVDEEQVLQTEGNNSTDFMKLFNSSLEQTEGEKNGRETTESNG
ncbi:SMC-Scp complex subunit ScpB [Ligilactobacillus saerimneri]|uniref:SMC-Scp complex subunit ScpB n=1 Tax=Ligilactobacillus saerimneri TaxID=228229 RepID=UPI001C0F900B|nr:SMC-Scp complex subunit ScpB [Ligilactobacillus saerimneri]MBU5309056.1 SMC-Scp complex subunit ScpB [Ligilactobacillus saerimneri]MDI9205699.1 SMC-Scp complex subunit ScpB [Ligilactobacillus saerimneri]